MNQRLLTTLLAGTASALFAQTPPAAEDPPPTPPPAPTTAPEPPKQKPRLNLKYTPPKDVAKGQRIDGDGGSRPGEMIKYPDWITTLTPGEGPALTTREQPSLFGFINQQTQYEVRFTITEPGKAEPAFVFAVSQCAPGIRRVNLAEYGLSLPVGKELKWSIIVRPNAENRSLDLTAFGFIKRVQPDPELVKKLKEAPAADHAAIYAEAGIWYDALAALSDQIAANPGDTELQAQRQSLLTQAGIKFESSASRGGATDTKAKPASTKGKRLKGRGEGDGGSR